MGTNAAMMCITPEFSWWIASTSQQCNTSGEKIEELLHTLSPYLKSQVLIRPNLTTLSEEHIRIFVGCGIVISNLLLLVFLNCRPAMRYRYIFFSLVSIGDIMDGSYLIFPSLTRIVEMAAGTFYRGVSLWDCARKGYMVFRIFGPEIVSLTMLVMAVEKAYAVLFTMSYRQHATNRARILAALACIVFCLFTLSIMFLTSYLAPRVIVQNDQYCGVSGSVTEAFAQFHQYFNLTCQIGAFLGSASAFLIARNLTKRANARELSSIKPILVVSFISCIVVSSSNIIYILKNFCDLNITKTQQNYAVTYSSAIFQVSKFVLYILTGQEFRDCLRRMIKERSCMDQTTVFVNRASTLKTNATGRWQ